ncbi:hypothetical protein [Streptomyces sp. MJP52]|uniref:hypothetical protein n=1 Tax=Streptomyces sp. MJP52 TaxID=2940555 RepID=UPI0024737E8E|nr:hypothetical protein [Streptomyces sp. MJP52]MDH6226248.1 hypothetical protein [Streptomyces sp. MJP52]
MASIPQTPPPSPEFEGLRTYLTEHGYTLDCGCGTCASCFLRGAVDAIAQAAPADTGAPALLARVAELEELADQQAREIATLRGGQLLTAAAPYGDKPVTVYRASLAYESIPLDHFTTREAARACCQAEARNASDYTDGPTEWLDDGDGTEVWWPAAGCTGYQVTAITAQPTFQADAEAGEDQ